MKNIIKQDINKVLVDNYMPYAVSVIEDRAMVGIDGMKPVHRRILYSMLMDGLLKGKRVKSAKAVGNILKYHPHGDSSVYEALTRLAQNDSLLLPLIDGKGNMGEHTSSTLTPAHMRYTESKLTPIVKELFCDLDKLDILMCPNFDESATEPMLLPTTFPHILANPSTGIAVGIASSICSFNLNELCDTTKAFIKDKDIDLLEYLKAPDFPTGGQILYNEKTLKDIYDTGRGSVILRAKYEINEEDNTIVINEIPYETTREKIIEKIIELIKDKTLTEIADINDLTDLKGMRIEITYKKNTNVETLLNKLFKLTPLQCSYSCNFYVLKNNIPKRMNIKEILNNWVDFRIQCIKTSTAIDKEAKIKESNIYEGYNKIINNLDRVVEILRFSENDTDIIDKLQAEFETNEEQTSHIINMKLKNINEKYLNSKIKELASIRKDIAELESIINSEDKIKSIIIAQLEEVQKKYGTPRKTEIITEHKTINKEDLIESYPVKVCITKEGYLKKIKASGYRESNNFTLKENDKLNIVLEADNKGYILLFTDKYNVYKKRINDFPDVKMSQLGTFLPNLIELEKEEKVTNAVYTMNFEENLLISFKHGNIAKIPLQSYCKSRNKLTGAYSNEDKVVSMFTCNDTDRIILKSSIDKILILDVKDLPSKKSKSTIGVSGMKSKDDSYVSICLPLQNVDGISNADYYKGNRNSVGKFLRKKLDEFIIK